MKLCGLDLESIPVSRRKQQVSRMMQDFSDLSGNMLRESIASGIEFVRVATGLC